MKTKIIFATGNANKMREIREILGEDNYDIKSMKEAGIDYVYQTVYELTHRCLVRLLGE